MDQNGVHGSGCFEARRHRMLPLCTACHNGIDLNALKCRLSQRLLAFADDDDDPVDPGVLVKYRRRVGQNRPSGQCDELLGDVGPRTFAFSGCDNDRGDLHGDGLRHSRLLRRNTKMRRAFC